MHGEETSPAESPPIKVTAVMTRLRRSDRGRTGSLR
jgi:hypothetical protein